MYALVDVNNMCVSCRTTTAPAMAQPWFQVRQLERSAGLIALSANVELYGDMSKRMMNRAEQHAPRQEIYGIDECFLDYDGVRGDLVAIGRALRGQVLRWTELPTSIGFGPLKTLAKLTNHIAKTAERKPESYPPGLAGVCHLGEMSAVQLDETMRRTDVGAVWGVGRKTSARLHEGGIRPCGTSCMPTRRHCDGSSM